MRNLIRLVVCVGGVCISHVSYSLDFSLRGGYEASYSTNSNQVPEDEVQQWTHAPEIAVGLTHDSNNLQIDGQYTALRRMFQQDDDPGFDDESVVTGTSTLIWDAVPERLEFELDHARTESTINAFQNRGPGNRQESQRATGRVVYNQPIVGRQRLRTTGSYTNRSFEETDNDASIIELDLSYVIPSSEVRGWEVFVRRAETEYDDFPDQDFALNNAGLRFNSSAPTGLLELELGYAETRPDDSAADEVSGLNGSFELRRGLTTPFEWGVLVAREIVDRSNILERGTIDIETDLSLVDTDLTEVFVETRAEVSLVRNSGRNRIALNLNRGEENYDEVARDRTSHRATLTLDRRLRETLSIQGQIGYSDEQFDDIDQDDELYLGQVEMIWDLSSRLQLGAEVSYQERHSSDPSVEFKEWIGMLRFSYQFIRPPTRS